MTVQLRNYVHSGGAGEGGRTSVDLDSLMMQAKEYLKAIKERNEYIDKRTKRASVELTRAEKLLEQISARKWNDTVVAELDKELNAARKLGQSARDMLWDGARRDTLSAENMTAINRKRIEAYSLVTEKIRQAHAHADDHLQHSDDKIKGAKEDLLLNMYDVFGAVNETLLPQLTEKSEACADRANQYDQLLNEYKRQFVFTAEGHATDLDRRAGEIRDSFRQTKDASAYAMKAAGAFRAIGEALENATSAVNETRYAAEAAYDAAYGQVEDAEDGAKSDSLITQADVSVNASRQLESQAHALDVQMLDMQRTAFESRLTDVNDKVIGARKSTDAVKKVYGELDKSHENLSTTVDDAKTVQDRAAKVDSELKQMADDVAQATAGLGKLEEFTVTNIQALTDHIRKTAEEVALAQTRMAQVMRQAEANQAAVAQLDDRLGLLREKINEAREKAARIRISVQSQESAAVACHRSYVSPASPTAINDITLHYRPARGVPNALVMITRTQRRRTQPSEYLALELKDKRLIFHWDIGGGAHMITNEKRIDYQPTSDHDTWYEVTVKRHGNSALLLVALVRLSSDARRQDEQVDQPVTVRASHADTFNIFNTQPGQTLLELGARAQSADSPLPANIGEHRFRGTLGDLEVDGVRVPLWQFKVAADTATGVADGCAGAVAPPRSSGNRGHLFTNGYAQIGATGHHDAQDQDRFTIVLYFAAYSPNGLIYFRGSRQSQDFISIELQDGHVVVQLRLGADGHLRLESSRAYNDGVTHVLTATRQRQSATLAIGVDDEVSGTVGGDSHTLHVRNEPHYVGGVPPSFNRSAWAGSNIRWTGFFGCVSQVRPNTDAPPLVLDKADKSLNMEPGCMRDEEVGANCSLKHLSHSETPHLLQPSRHIRTGGRHGLSVHGRGGRDGHVEPLDAGLRRAHHPRQCHTRLPKQPCHNVSSSHSRVGRRRLHHGVLVRRLRRRAPGHGRARAHQGGYAALDAHIQRRPTAHGDAHAPRGQRHTRRRRRGREADDVRRAGHHRLTAIAAVPRRVPQWCERADGRDAGAGGRAPARLHQRPARQLPPRAARARADAARGAGRVPPAGRASAGGTDW